MVFFMIHGKLYVCCMIFPENQWAHRWSSIVHPSFIVLDAKCQAFAVEQPPGRHSALDFCRTNTKKYQNCTPYQVRFWCFFIAVRLSYSHRLAM